MGHPLARNGAALAPFRANGAHPSARHRSKYIYSKISISYWARYACQLVRQYNRGGDHWLVMLWMKNTTLNCLVELWRCMWMTVRGFAIVSNWLEEYKRAKDKLLKGAKSLRKGLKTAADNYGDHV